ncbi:hypothetical protein F2Q68_00041558 [Brassica cretica]|uniref:Methionine--tRNA ligase n=1 Tax=Brassica cretica TaxID=69181 RepID=A0A8S9MQM9_BRACR|nr:hypothetical protein F2Q68_00041558 [Brassica cretica]
MAARLNTSLQNTLSLLNPFNTLLTKKPFASRNSFRFSKKLPSSPRRALYCTSTLESHDNAETFVLTTPLYYVNAPPHMGSAYTTIAADSIARFQFMWWVLVKFQSFAVELLVHVRLLGKKVIFITGTDEHGEKIATSAAANGRNPSEHCDLISQSYRTLWKELDIAYDKFVRTTDPKHEAIVKEFYDRVFANGDIYRADYEGLYCVNCEEYKDEKELLENNCCPVHQMPCVARKEDNYFFALSKYQKPLEEVLSQNPRFVQPSYRLNEDGMKMGKSLGNTLEPFELVQKFGPDAVRYFFIREVEFGNDGDYSEDRFIKIVNAHLANTIGNLLNRTLGLLKKNCESTLVVDSTIAAEGVPLKDTVEKLVEKARTNYESLSLSTACEAVLEIGNAGNSYMDQRAPWMLFKQGGVSAEAAAKDLVIILEVMRIIAVALSPIAPCLSLKIYSQLGFSVDQFNSITWDDTKWGELREGQVMAQASPVFVRIELDAAEKDEEEKKPKDSKKKGKAKVKAEQQPQTIAEA